MTVFAAGSQGESSLVADRTCGLKTLAYAPSFWRKPETTYAKFIGS
jgi:hypothetical protein